MKHEVYVFDQDGVLIDSMERFTGAMLSILDEENISYDRDDMVKVLTPLGYKGVAEYFIAVLGIKADSVDEIIKRIATKLLHEYTYNIKLKPNVYTTLCRLKERGAKLYVLTASPHLVTDVCLQRNGVFDLFEKVWSVDDYGLDKSSEEIFHRLAENVGCEECNIHYFDDNITAISNATKAGLDTYGVYDNHTPEMQAQMIANCNRYILDFSEIE